MWNSLSMGRVTKQMSLVVVVFLLSGCQGSLIKEAAKHFDKATQSAIDGTTSLVVQYDNEQIWRIAADNRQQNIVPKDIAGLLEYDGHVDTAARIDALKSLKLYADALAQLASVGSAKANSDALSALGKSVEQGGAENGATYGKLIGTLASLIFDAKIGTSVKKLATQADPTVQQLTTQLRDEIDLIAPTIRTNLNARYTSIRNAHAGLDCPSSCTEEQKLRATELLLALNHVNELRGTITEQKERAKSALQAMADAHSALARGARGEDKALLIKSVTAYIKSANDLQDLLDKLES